MGDGGLLKWAQYYTRGHDHIKPVTDLTKCWADGLAFCALLYNWFPDKIPINDLKVDTDTEKINNCELAFKVAEDAGINKYLDGDDMIVVQDKKSIVLYLSEIFRALNDITPKWTPSEEWLREAERKMINDKKISLEAAKGLGTSSQSASPKGQNLTVTRSFKASALTQGGGLWTPPPRQGGNSLSASQPAHMPTNDISPRSKEEPRLSKKNLGKEMDNISEDQKPGAEDKISPLEENEEKKT